MELPLAIPDFLQANEVIAKKKPKKQMQRVKTRNEDILDVHLIGAFQLGWRSIWVMDE